MVYVLSSVRHGTIIMLEMYKPVMIVMKETKIEALATVWVECEITLVLRREEWSRKALRGDESEILTTMDQNGTVVPNTEPYSLGCGSLVS